MARSEGRARTIALGFLVCLWAAGITAVAARAGGEVAPLPIEFFHATGCDECERVEREILPELTARFAGVCEVIRFDTGEETNYVRLVGWQAALGVTNNEPVAMVVDGRAMLSGVEGIRTGLLPAVEAALSARAAGEPRAARPDPSPAAGGHALVSQRVRGFTLAGVVTAALVDSLNPCAMATLVFFMSLLSVAHIGVRRMWLAGGAFVVACYATYFALGFGLLRVLRALEAVRRVGLAIDALLLAVMVVFAWLSFRDAVRFRRTGKSGSVSLQLPEGIRERIHTVMKRGLHRRNLLLGGLGIGVLVTLLESVCTGQVYVPALVFMIKSGESVWRCAGYLAVYNAVFVAPLLVLLALTCWGLGTPALVAWSRRNVARSKVLLGLFFTAMAAMMLVMILRTAG